MLAFLLRLLGTQEVGDEITVTFYNVKVENPQASESVKVLLAVDDEIIGSDYDKMTLVEVIPMRLGDVAVTSDDPITAGGTVDLKVKYTATQAMSFGRIQVTLPTSDTIYEERQPGNADATYVTVDKSRSVVLATDTDGDPDYLSVAGDTVTIDVDTMSRRQYVTLTVHNFSIAALTTDRKDRYEDIETAMLTDMVQVTVLSEQYTDATARSGSPVSAA